MLPHDRSRVPPDVARRLAVLAARPSDVTPGPAVPSDASSGREGDGPGHGHGRDVLSGGVAPPGPASSGADRPWQAVPTVTAEPPTGWTPDVPGSRPRVRDDPSRSRPAHADTPGATGPAVGRAGAPAGAWDPSVLSALAAASTSASARPAPHDGAVPVAAAVLDSGGRDQQGRPRRARVRWAPDWRATGAAVLVLALVAGGVVLRAAAAPQGEAVRLPTPAVPAGPAPADPPSAAYASADALPTDGGAAGAEPSTGRPGEVVVHVVGAVAVPGLVRLPPGARVADAIDAAGGSGAEADLAGVNLARAVADGEQLVVPVLGASPPAAVAAPAGTVPAADGMVDLNTAAAAALEELPGVGPVLAERIVEHRAQRPFTTVDELDDVTGIGPALMARLRPLVRV